MTRLSDLPPHADSILLVDDEQDILDALQDLLEGAIGGVQVRKAGDGDTALRMLDEAPVDLILSDYRMPGRDGLDFLSAARERHPLIPSILITAFPDREVARRAIAEAQVENFLTKPVKPTELLEAVHAALLKSRRRRQEWEAFQKRTGRTA